MSLFAFCLIGWKICSHLWITLGRMTPNISKSKQWRVSFCFFFTTGGWPQYNCKRAFFLGTILWVFSPFLGWVALLIIFQSIKCTCVASLVYISCVFIFFILFQFSWLFLYWSFVLMRLQKPGLTITCIIYQILISSVI